MNRSYTLTKGIPKGKTQSVCLVVPELEGLPGLVTRLEKRNALEVKLSVDKPARVYAYINWYWSAHETAERERRA